MLDKWVRNVMVAILVTLGVTMTAVAQTPKLAGVVVDQKLFYGKNVTVLLNRTMAHKEIKNQKFAQDHWELQSVEIVQVGEKAYLKGRALNGPVNFKGKVVWFDMNLIQIIKEE